MRHRDSSLRSGWWRQLALDGFFHGRLTCAHLPPRQSHPPGEVQADYRHGNEAANVETDRKTERLVERNAEQLDQDDTSSGFEKAKATRCRRQRNEDRGNG